MVDELNYGGWDGAVPKNVDELYSIIRDGSTARDQLITKEKIKEKLNDLWWGGELDTKAMNRFLSTAAWSGSSDIMKVLLDYEGYVSGGIAPKSINNAFARAAGRGNGGIVKMLFEEHGQKITPEGINKALV
jgi:hypothetical protein